MSAVLPNPFGYDSKVASAPAVTACCPQSDCDCTPAAETAAQSADSDTCDICHTITNLTDASTDLSEFFESLSSLPSFQSLRRVSVRADSPTAPLILTKLVTLYAHNIDLTFLSPVLYGAAGGLRLMGDQPEVIRGATYKAKLAADAMEGATVLHLSATGDTMQAIHFTVGDTIILRGQNDAAGKALTKQTLHVLGINLDGANTLRVESLEFDFLTVYPESDWPADLTTGTTISLAAFAQFVSSYVPGTIIAAVDPDQLAGSGIGVGSVVLVSTNEVEIDLNPNAPYHNSARLELKKIVAFTNDGLDATVTFDTPLVDSYDTAKFAGITLYNPIINSTIRGVRASYSMDQASRNTHGIQIGYGYKCAVVDCEIDGSGGQRGNGIRISNSLECDNVNCRVSNPKNFISAEGYGHAVYYSDRCRIINSTGEGCRHNFLLQKANHTTVAICTSLNDRISGFDVHGVNSINSHFFGCRGIGGALKTLDAHRKSIFRVGNTSHAVGDFGTLIEGCFISGALISGAITRYAALEVFGASSGVVMRGCLIEDCQTGLCAGYDNGADDDIGFVNVAGNTWNRVAIMRDFQTGPTIQFSNGLTRVFADPAEAVFNFAIPVDTSAPTIAQGTEVVSASYTATQPGLIKVTFVAPFMNIATTGSVVACIFVGNTLIGTAVVRCTVGASTGEQIICIGTYYGTGVAETVSVRMGPHTPGVNVTLNPASNNWAGANCPFMLIEEK